MGMGNSEALKLPCAAKCEYLQRWVKAKEADHTVMNYSYYLIQMNYVLTKMEAYAPFSARRIVICDEAHKLPDIIENHFACSIDLQFVDKITRCISMISNLGHRDHGIDHSGVTYAIQKCLMLDVKSDNKKHLDSLIRLHNEYTLLKDSIEKLKTILAAKYLPKRSNVDDLRRMARKLPKEVRALIGLADSLKDRHCKIEDYIDNINNHGIENMIADNEGEVRTYHNLSDSNLFQKHFAAFSDIRVYMSATLQPELLIRRCGIDPAKSMIMNIDSSWDLNKSPVILCNTANMSYIKYEQSIKTVIRKIDSILMNHPNERGVIHTTSKVIAEDIINGSKFASRLFGYLNTANKMEILNDFSTYPKNAVIIGPSLTTGVDLKDDLGRFNIVVKISYPNISNALWAKRAESFQHIYIGEAASILEQSCGRTTRSKNDSSRSYILDSRAESFILGNQKYFSPTFLKRVRIE